MGESKISGKVKENIYMYGTLLLAPFGIYINKIIMELPLEIVRLYTPINVDLWSWIAGFFIYFAAIGMVYDELKQKGEFE